MPATHHYNFLSAEFTLISRNLFLFCEGAGVLIHQGSQGIQVARNIIEGCGSGISVNTHNTIHFYHDWEFEEDGEQWYEVACIRIYRNLIYRCDRVDKNNCDQQGDSGRGIYLKVDGVIPSFSLSAGSDESEDTEETEETEVPLYSRSPRLRDVWIVNNTIMGNPLAGIEVVRDAAPAGYQARVKDIRIMNNVVCYNGYSKRGTTQIVLTCNEGDEPIKDHWPKFTLPELQSITIERNWCVDTTAWDTDLNGAATPDRKTQRGYSLDGLILSAASMKNGESYQYQTSWDAQTGKLDLEWETTWTPPSSSTLSERLPDPRLRGPGIDWDWFAIWTDLDAEWPTLPTAWNQLPGEWDSQAYEPDPFTSWLVDKALSTTGLLDLDAMEQGYGQMDVGQGPDLFFRSGSNHEIGALRSEHGRKPSTVPVGAAGIVGLPALYGSIGLEAAPMRRQE